MAAKITIVIKESKSGEFDFKITGDSIEGTATFSEMQTADSLMQRIDSAINVWKLRLSEEKRNEH
ncbi:MULTISPECIES: hypothetical protein [Providencia]|uniref:hypothetical protein n=1 Tax=Providencia TaxID=586 RepID=UPI00140A0EC3|nr:hypothetical protein [Providencia sp. M-27]